MFDTGAVLATIDVEFYVKYELPEFLNQALANFFVFLFSISSMLESKGCQRKQEVVDKIIYQHHIENTIRGTRWLLQGKLTF